MTSRPSDQVVRRGSFLYEAAVRCRVEIVRTDFRPGVADDEAPEDDACGEFCIVRYFSPGSTDHAAGGGYHDSLVDAVDAVESRVRDIQWEH